MLFSDLCAQCCRNAMHCNMCVYYEYSCFYIYIYMWRLAFNPPVILGINMQAPPIVTKLVFMSGCYAKSTLNWHIRQYNVVASREVPFWLGHFSTSKIPNWWSWGGVRSCITIWGFGAEVFWTLWAWPSALIWILWRAPRYPHFELCDARPDTKTM